MAVSTRRPSKATSLSALRSPAPGLFPEHICTHPSRGASLLLPRSLELHCRREDGRSVSRWVNIGRGCNPTMNSEFCNHAVPQRHVSWTRLVWLLTLILGPAALSANAQGNVSNHAQASLHIQVNIVRVTMGHDPDPREHAASGAVLFDLPSAGGLKMSETEEMRSLTSSERLALHTGTGGDAVLRTRTVVLP